MFCAALLAALSIGASASAAQKTVTLTVENMTCALCPITVSKAAKAVTGVERVNVDLDGKAATVVFDDAVTSTGAVAAAITNAGYPATPRE
jgi:mercuric ion binding protein